MSENTSTHYEFRAVIRKVEERFARSYDVEKLGEAKAESQVEYKTISTGWWVLLEGWPVAMRFGNLKPLVKEGDTMCIVMHVITLVGANAPAAT